jgi:hypothetical protein
MSVEYLADVATTAATIAALRDAVAGEPAYELLPSPRPGHLRLRRRDATPRSLWTEDVEIEIFARQITVACHAATAGERAALIARLEATLAGLGTPATFTEA